MPFVCPICDSVSHNENDIRERYCVRCHFFIPDIEKYFSIDKVKEFYAECKRDGKDFTWEAIILAL